MSDLDEIPSMASSIVGANVVDDNIVDDNIVDANVVDDNIVDVNVVDDNVVDANIETEIVDAEIDAEIDVDEDEDDAEIDVDESEDDIDADDIEDDDEDEDDEDDDEDGDEETDVAAIDDEDEDKAGKKAKKNKKKVIVVDPDEFLGTSINGPETIETTAEDYDSDDDEYEAEDFQKLDDEMRKNYITMNHPESITQNYDEIYKLSKIVRNKNNIIIDSAHRTLPMLTKYEKARILGVRAKQINNGAVPFIELKENIIDGYLIAERELAEKKIPFIIRRPIPNRGSEYWRLEDLEII